MTTGNNKPDDGWTEINLSNNDLFEVINHFKLQTLYFSCQLYLGYLIKLSNLMEADASIDYGPDVIKCYAYEVEDTAKILKQLLQQIKQ